MDKMLILQNDGLPQSRNLKWYIIPSPSGNELDMDLYEYLYMYDIPTTHSLELVFELTDINGLIEELQSLIDHLQKEVVK